jgi:cytochrome c553
MKQWVAIALLVCVVFPGAEAADLAAGRARSLACQACHGPAGIGTAPDIPNLAGQKQPYLQAQLAAFRAKDRKHDLMNAIAGQLSDADIADLAAFWSSLPATAAHGAAAGTEDPAAQIRKSRMTFPATFPKDFLMYHESRDDKGNVASRSYANRAAVDAARGSAELPAGSVIVVENLTGQQVSSYAAMESRAGWGDAVPELLRNGDWNYALFDARRELLPDFNYARCLACHKPLASSSYVFGLEGIGKAR